MEDREILAALGLGPQRSEVQVHRLLADPEESAKSTACRNRRGVLWPAVVGQAPERGSNAQRFTEIVIDSHAGEFLPGTKALHQILKLIHRTALDDRLNRAP